MLKNEHVKCTRLRNKIIKWEVTQNDTKCRCRQCCREDYHCSNVLQNFLISDLALLSVQAVVIACGALFHSLAVSLLTLSLIVLQLASSLHNFKDEFLIDLPVSTLSGLFFSM